MTGQTASHHLQLPCQHFQLQIDPEQSKSDPRYGSVKITVWVAQLLRGYAEEQLHPDRKAGEHSWAAPGVFGPLQPWIVKLARKPLGCRGELVGFHVDLVLARRFLLFATSALTKPLEAFLAWSEPNEPQWYYLVRSCAVTSDDPSVTTVHGL